MALLELWITETIASGAIALGLRKVGERANVRARLLCQDEEKPIPLIDDYLESLSGVPENRKERLMSARIVQFARFLVNRQAFRHLVDGCVNSNSQLRQKLPWLTKFRKD